MLNGCSLMKKYWITPIYNTASYTRNKITGVEGALYFKKVLWHD
jgi:hypothetical protein